MTTNEPATSITVIDAMMGAGKTTYLIDMMNHEGAGAEFADDDSEPSRFIYITPLLSEVERVQAACQSLGFTEPKPIKGRKIEHFNRMVAEGTNIVTTHALFAMMNQETYQHLAEAGYTLVVDEETECVKEYILQKDDWRTLYENGMVYIDDKRRVRWNHEKWPEYRGKFDDIKALCDNGNLVRSRDELLVWEFPIEFLKLFGQVYIATYLFEGSLLSSYLKANDMPYETKTIKDGELVDLEAGDERQRKQALRGLINLVDDAKLNAVGKPKAKENPLSHTWFERCRKAESNKTGGSPELKKLKNAVYMFFRHIAKGKSKENMWSCFKVHRALLKGAGYARGWTQCNLRATNQHRHTRNLAYLVNVFQRPRLVNYFQECGVEPNQDLYALSQLVQWIWRSQIRDDKPINLYIPSQRMRELFKKWLEHRSSYRQALTQGATEARLVGYGGLRLVRPRGRDPKRGEVHA